MRRFDSIRQHVAHGTPERAVADAFSAFRQRDVARLTAVATSASVRAFAARVGPGLDAGDARTPSTSTGELTDTEAASILGRVVAHLPEFFTASVRCVIVGHVLEWRLDAATPDGRGLISLDCRVAGGDGKWLSAWAIYGNGQIYREIANPAAVVAHMVFGVDLAFPGKNIDLTPELQIATTQLVGGEWKLVLDEESDAGLPGLRGLGFWIDEGSTAETPTDDSITPC